MWQGILQGGGNWDEDERKPVFGAHTRMSGESWFVFFYLAAFTHQYHLVHKKHFSPAGGTFFPSAVHAPLRETRTIDRPQIGHSPDPDKSLALTISLAGEEFGCMTARPPPQ
jgi:hypothetical protein